MASQKLRQIPPAVLEDNSHQLPMGPAFHLIFLTGSIPRSEVTLEPTSMIENPRARRPRMVSTLLWIMAPLAGLILSSAGCGEITGNSGAGSIDLSKVEPENIKAEGVPKGGSMRGGGLGGAPAPNAKKPGR